MNDPIPTLTLKFTPRSIQDMQVMAKNLNKSIEHVVEEGLALLKIVQGRRIILKEKNEAFEIKKYKNLPTQIILKVNE